jgi:glycosyltransferase involved in cell wall biosynthesis
VGNFSADEVLLQLKDLAKALNVEFEARVRIEDTELVQLLNRAVAMVYAPRLEPFGLAPLEANACGLPVIAVAEGGVRETIVDGENGLLVEHDPRAMARAIERLVTDKSYARRLGKTAAKVVTERWSLEASLDRLEQRFAGTLELARGRMSGRSPMPHGRDGQKEKRHTGNMAENRKVLS